MISFNKEELIDAIAKGVKIGMELYNADRTSIVEPDKPTKPTKPAKKAAPKKKALAAITYEALLKEVKGLMAGYIEGPQAGKEIAMETLSTEYKVTKFSDLNANQYAFALETMKEVLA